MEIETEDSEVPPKCVANVTGDGKRKWKTGRNTGGWKEYSYGLSNGTHGSGKQEQLALCDLPMSKLTTLARH